MTNGYTIEQAAVPLDEWDRRAAPRGSADAQLVGRVLAGELAAFDSLVLRHRATVLKTARASVGDWDRAEDVAQQAFIEALSGLRGLREPARFRSWLITITKRCAARSFRAPEPALVEFTDTVLYPLPAVQPDPALDDLRERVRASLHDLSARSRTVVVLHYLDGYSCREIGAQLGIPDGTVKRILHESRESMRRSMGVTRPHTKGVPTEMATKNIGSRDLVWWINGDTGPGAIMHGALPESICLATNKTAMTARQIAKIVDANVRYVHEAIFPLVEEGLMEKRDSEQYRTNFIALDAEDYIGLTEGIREHGIKAADALQPLLPEMETAWNRTALPEQGYSWEKGIWSTLAIFTLNTGLGRRHPPEPEPPLRASGHRYWMGGREPVPDDHVLWVTGFNNISSNDDKLNYGYFWSYGLPQERAPLGGKDLRSLLTLLAEGASDYEVIAERSGRTVDQVRESLAVLIETGVLRKDKDHLSLSFPVFREAESGQLISVVDKAAAGTYEQAVVPAIEHVSDRLRHMGYGHLEEQFPEWHLWLSGSVGGEALRELLRRGVLPDRGSPVPPTFGLIGWFGYVALMRRCQG